MIKTSAISLHGLRIFLVDDEDKLAWSIEQSLRELGAEVLRASNLKEAFAKFPSFSADLAISDINLPDGNGLDLLKKWRKDDPSLPVILITAHTAVDSAITALRLGAFDYLPKPFDMKDLIAAVKRAAEVSSLRRRVSEYEGRPKSGEPLAIIGESAPMQKLRKLISRVAASKVDTVLIHGESGSGKELAARAIHEWSDRSNEPFVEINCASIPEALLESELFGYEKGAFTDAKDRKLGLFEIAKRGTVFLDEVGEMPAKLQAKLLRVVEYRRFKRLGGTSDIDFLGRIVAATNRRLEEEIVEGNFRGDLFYRLNIVPIVVPSLRERPSDIPALVDHLLDKISESLEVVKPQVSDDAMLELKEYSWPGNVRELKNILQRTIIFHQPKVITSEILEIRAAKTAPSRKLELKDKVIPSENAEVAESSSRDKSTDVPFLLPADGINLEDLEKSLLIQALERARYNQTKAAQLLRVTRHTLRYRLEKFGLLMGNM